MFLYRLFKTLRTLCGLGVLLLLVVAACAFFLGDWSQNGTGLVLIFSILFAGKAFLGYCIFAFLAWCSSPEGEGEYQVDFEDSYDRIRAKRAKKGWWSK